MHGLFPLEVCLHGPVSHLALRQLNSDCKEGNLNACDTAQDADGTRSVLTHVLLESLLRAFSFMARFCWMSF